MKTRRTRKYYIKSTNPIEVLQNDIAELEKEHNNLMEELNEFNEDFEIRAWEYCMKLEELDEERQNKEDRKRLREYWEFAH